MSFKSDMLIAKKDLEKFQNFKTIIRNTFENLIRLKKWGSFFFILDTIHKKKLLHNHADNKIRLYITNHLQMMKEF